MAKQDKSENDAPVIEAPANQTGARHGPDAPTELEDLDFGAGSAKVSALPSLVPPGEELLEAKEGASASAWHNDKQITAMWCNSSVRNAYASIEGIGWKRISNANDGSWISLTMLCSHAEATNSKCNIRTESDGMIHEIYVW